MPHAKVKDYFSVWPRFLKMWERITLVCGMLVHNDMLHRTRDEHIILEFLWE